MKVLSILFMSILLVVSCKKDNSNTLRDKEIIIDLVSVNNVLVSDNGSADNVNISKVEVKISFNTKVDTTLFNKSKLFFTVDIDTNYSYKFSNNSTSLTVIPLKKILGLTRYRMVFDVGPNLGGVVLKGFSFTFTTCIDS
jgi:hypothetical protein